MDKKPFEIKDVMKWDTCTEVVRRFSGESRLKNNFTMEEFMAYILDNIKGEEGIAFLAHFGSECVAIKKGEGEPTAAEVMALIGEGIKNNAYSASGQRPAWSKPNVANSVISRMKFDIFGQAKAEKGYRHETDYNANEPVPELTNKEVVFAYAIATKYASFFKRQGSELPKTPGVPSTESTKK